MLFGEGCCFDDKIRGFLTGGCVLGGSVWQWLSLGVPVRGYCFIFYFIFFLGGGLSVIPA